jgi:hypothetical protein
MFKWKAYLTYPNRTMEFTVYARDYVDAQDKIERLFPKVPYSITMV